MVQKSIKLRENPGENRAVAGQTASHTSEVSQQMREKVHELKNYLVTISCPFETLKQYDYCFTPILQLSSKKRSLVAHFNP